MKKRIVFVSMLLACGTNLSPCGGCGGESKGEPTIDKTWKYCSIGCGIATGVGLVGMAYNIIQWRKNLAILKKGGLSPLEVVEITERISSNKEYAAIFGVAGLIAGVGTGVCWYKSDIRCRLAKPKKKKPLSEDSKKNLSKILAYAQLAESEKVKDISVFGLDDAIFGNNNYENFPQKARGMFANSMQQQFYSTFGLIWNPLAGTFSDMSTNAVIDKREHFTKVIRDKEEKLKLAVQFLNEYKQDPNKALAENKDFFPKDMSPDDKQNIVDEMRRLQDPKDWKKIQDSENTFPIFAIPEKLDDLKNIDFSI